MPEPRKINLRIPEDLHADLLARAEWECSSANAVMVAALRHWLARSASKPGASKARATLAAAPSMRQRPAPERIERPAEGVNAPCPCGSGRKWKKCHGAPASG